MKVKNLLVMASLSAAIVFSGCSSMSTTQKSTAKGAAIGAGAGAVVGAGTGLAVAAIAGKNKKKAVIIGAAAGTAVGATAGAIIGNKIGKKKQALQDAANNATIEETTDVNGNKALEVTFSEGALNFATGKSVVGATGKTELAAFAKSLVAGEASGEIYNVQVTGHTDKTGSLEVNQKVSKDRANAVANILKSNGIAAAHIVADGLDYQLYDDSKSAAQNRCVKVYISASQEMINAAESGKLQ
ncbi:MAG: OmpA family protein [Marinilabiliaceae bacterium]|nr:OmpA family protein [Marinilabiliaceae bacterium]